MKYTQLLSTLFWFSLTGSVFAGAGHEHPPEPGSKPAAAAASSKLVVITESSARNLGLKTVEAEIVQMSPSSSFLAKLTLPPENHAKITTRVEGSVSRIDVKKGQSVQAGDVLMEVTPHAVGTQPYPIKTPIAGVVLSLDTALGQGFGQETILIQIADMSTLLVEAAVFQTPEIFTLKTGAAIAFHPDADPVRSVQGKLDRMEAALDPGSNTLRVYGAISNPDGLFKPNMTGRLEISTGESQSVIAAPAAAVLGELGNLFMFVEIEPFLYERREIEIGMRANNLVDLISGVGPGDKVVTVGAYQLQYVSPASGATMEELHGHAH